MTTPDAERLQLLKELYKTNHENLVRWLWGKTGDRGVAEELAKDTWVEFMTAGIADLSTPMALVQTIATRNWIDWLKKRVGRQTYQVGDVLEFVIQEFTSDANQFGRLDEVRIAEVLDIDAAVSTLEPRLKKIVMEHYFYRKERKVIAADLGISETRVKQLLKEARDALAAAPALTGYREGRKP